MHICGRLPQAISDMKKIEGVLCFQFDQEDPDIPYDKVLCRVHIL